MKNKILADIFSELERKEVFYFLLRSFGTDDDDIDLMLLKEELYLFEGILNKYNVVKIDSKLYSPHIQYHVPYIRDDRVYYLIIDCLFDFIFGRDMIEIKPSIDLSLIRKGLKNKKGYNTVSTEFQVLFLCIHFFLEGGSLYRKEEILEYLSFSNTLLLTDIFNNAFRTNITELTSFSDISSFFSKMNFHKPYHFYFLKFSSFVKRNFIFRKGLIISLVGVDGSGKSTAGKLVEQNILTNNYYSANFLYLGERKLPKIISSNFRRKKTNRFLRVFYKLLSHIYYIASRFQKNLFLYFSSFKSYIITDRYILDRFIPSPNTSIINRKAVAILAFHKLFFIKADLIFLLVGDPDVISSRKCEYSSNKTAKGMLFQKQVFDCLGINYIEIDTTNNDINHSVQKITLEILNRKRKDVYNA